MAANCGKSTTREAVAAEEAEEVKEDDTELASNVSVAHIHTLLDDMAMVSHKSGAERESEEQEQGSKSFRTNLATATKIGADLWGQQHLQWGETAAHGNMLLPAEMLQSAPDAGNKRKKRKKDVAPAAAHTTMHHVNVEHWFEDLQNSAKPPNAQQLAVLHAVRDRCTQEAAESTAAAAGQPVSEPLRACVLGVPGAGKRECIRGHSVSSKNASVGNTVYNFNVWHHRTQWQL